MKKITLLGVMAISCLCAAAQDDTFIPTQKPDSCYLGVGDTVPDIPFYSTACAEDSFKRSSLKAKLVLLDVWSTTCVPCIRQFPKLDSLQQAFNSQLQVVLVTTNSNKKIAQEAEAVLLRFEASVNKTLHFPSTYLTRRATSLFFFQANTPHYIWMNGAGRIIATTGAEEVTANNIAALLRGQEVIMALKPAFTPLEATPVNKTIHVLLTP